MLQSAGKIKKGQPYLLYFQLSMAIEALYTRE